jgi:four helix bundle protein
VQEFRNLKVWQKAHALTLAVYQATTNFPGEERFGLTVQLRRTAASIPTNLADGSGRATDGEFSKLLSAATGAASQLDYQLLLARDLGYLREADYTRLTAEVVEVKRIIAGLIQTLNC